MHWRDYFISHTKRTDLKNKFLLIFLNTKIGKNLHLPTSPLPHSHSSPSSASSPARAPSAAGGLAVGSDRGSGRCVLKGACVTSWPCFLSQRRLSHYSSGHCASADWSSDLTPTICGQPQIFLAGHGFHEGFRSDCVRCKCLPLPSRLFVQILRVRFVLDWIREIFICLLRI
jgi:hypothetical protein